MLEKALISAVVHQREETVYRVDGVAPATLFGALADAAVNVDTIVQTGPEIVFSASGRGPARREPRARRARRRVERARRPRQGLGDRRRHEEPPRHRREDLRHARARGNRAGVVSTSPIKIACHVETGQVDQAVQALHDAFGLGAFDLG